MLREREKAREGLSRASREGFVFFLRFIFNFLILFVTAFSVLGTPLAPQRVGNNREQQPGIFHSNKIFKIGVRAF